MGKPAILGGINFTDAEAKRLKTLAKKSVAAQEDFDKRAADYRKKIDALDGEINSLNGQIRDWKNSYGAVARDRDSWKENYNRLWAEVKPYIEAIRKFPQQLLNLIREHLPLKNHNKEVQR
jgi:chromosome segregation ATPase